MDGGNGQPLFVTDPGSDGHTSQASPLTSPSESSWPGLGFLGQLSSVSGTPSPSRSGIGVGVGVGVDVPTGVPSSVQ